MNILYEQCKVDISQNNYIKAQYQTCTPIFTQKLIGSTNLSPYDTKKPLDTNYFEHIRRYLDRSDVKTALSINSFSNYHNCDNVTFINFLPEFHQKIPDDYIPNMLKKYRVLLY